MGWCHEFGPDINADCEHPMLADAKSCRCATCGVVCTGRFPACAAVWAAGPRNVTAVRVRSQPPAPSAANPVETVPDEPAVADDSQLEAFHADLAGVARRLDDIGLEDMRSDVAALARRLDEAQLGEVRKDVAAVARRLDEAAIDAVHADLAAVLREIDHLSAAVEAQNNELQKLAERPKPGVQRMVDKLAHRSSHSGRPPERDQAPPPDEAAASRRSPTAAPPDSPLAPDPVQPAAPAAAEPEQIDLAVPLDQALVRPVRPGANGEPGRR